MGQRELLETLRREGDEQAAFHRRAAEQESQLLRTAAAERLREMRTAHAEQCKRLFSSCQREVMAEAEREAALVRLRAEHALVLRLQQQAEAGLERLRRERGDSLLQRLAAELPAEAWAVIRVNPADAASAAALFPGAEIQTDISVRGGLSAVTADGGFAVINTLEARLERIWPDLLPQIMAEVRGKHS